MAAANAAVSFIPSPTIRTVAPSFPSSEIRAALASGRASDITSSIPIRAAKAVTAASTSPEIRITRFPSAFRPATTSGGAFTQGVGKGEGVGRCIPDPQIRGRHAGRTGTANPICAPKANRFAVQHAFDPETGDFAQGLDPRRCHSPCRKAAC